MKVVFLTATQHANLHLTAESIKTAVEHHSDVEFEWRIYADIFNWSSDITEYRSSIVDNLYSDPELQVPHVKLRIIPITILDGKPHYGGTLFNEILHDPGIRDADWLYILDNDNIVHPLLIPTICKVDKTKPTAELIWTSCKLNTGIVRECPRELCYHAGDNGIIPSQFMPDPSQMVIKKSLLRTIGGYAEGFHYDWDTSFKLMSHKIFDSDLVAYYHDFDGYGKDKWHTYWNGAIELKQLTRWISLLETNEFTAGELSLESSSIEHFDSKNRCTISIPLSREEQLKLLKYLVELRENGHKKA